jgi:hypothetical protein
MIVRHTLGQVNLSGYLRVSLEKVGDPGVEVDVQYIPLPFTNYVYLSPEIDADNYYIFFREATDTLSLGTLRSQAFFSAQSKEFEYERRFYTIGALPTGVTSTLTNLNDPYLVNKDVTGVQKEAFRYLEPATEFTYDNSTGDIDLLTQNFSGGEKFVVELKFNIGSSSSVVTGPLFSSTITVTGSTYSMNALDKNKRFCLDCSGDQQVFTLCSLSGLVTGDRAILEHKRDGVQAQTRILPFGTEKIRFNGFAIDTIDLSELWISKGHSLYLRKEGSVWEVILECYGVHVGERMSGTYGFHPNWKPEDGTLYDGDKYPGLYWWVKNVLPSAQKITDDTVVSGGYAHPSGKEGLFVIHSTLKKFRMPNTQGLYEKGLKNFLSYGADTDRIYDYPGGRADGRNKEHGHGISTSNGSASGSLTSDPVRATTPGTVNTQGLEWTSGPDSKTIRKSGGPTNEVTNCGVIFLRNIG